MKNEVLRIGYVPLIDAAPLIVAQEIGFAAEEGLSFDLVRQQSWAQSRDMLGMGGIDAAHMLVPLPIAQVLGLGPDYLRFDLVMFLSQGGQAIAISAALQRALKDIGHGFSFNDPAAARDTLALVAGKRLRVGCALPVFDAGFACPPLAERVAACNGSVDPYRAAPDDGQGFDHRRGRCLLRG